MSAGRNREKWFDGDCSRVGENSGVSAVAPVGCDAEGIRVAHRPAVEAGAKAKWLESRKNAPSIQLGLIGHAGHDFDAAEGSSGAVERQERGAEEDALDHGAGAEEPDAGGAFAGVDDDAEGKVGRGDAEGGIGDKQ